MQQASQDPPLLAVRSVRDGHGPPLPMDEQLHRHQEPEGFSPLQLLHFSHWNVCRCASADWIDFLLPEPRRMSDVTRAVGQSFGDCGDVPLLSVCLFHVVHADWLNQDEDWGDQHHWPQTAQPSKRRSAGSGARVHPARQKEPEWDIGCVRRLELPVVYSDTHASGQLFAWGSIEQRLLTPLIITMQQRSITTTEGRAQHWFAIYFTFLRANL